MCLLPRPRELSPTQVPQPSPEAAVLALPWLGQCPALLNTPAPSLSKVCGCTLYVETRGVFQCQRDSRNGQEGWSQRWECGLLEVFWGQSTQDRKVGTGEVA